MIRFGRRRGLFQSDITRNSDCVGAVRRQPPQAVYFLVMYQNTVTGATITPSTLLLIANG